MDGDLYFYYHKSKHFMPFLNSLFLLFPQMTQTTKKKQPQQPSSAMVSPTPSGQSDKEEAMSLAEEVMSLHSQGSSVASPPPAEVEISKSPPPEKNDQKESKGKGKKGRRKSARSKKR